MNKLVFLQSLSGNESLHLTAQRSCLRKCTILSRKKIDFIAQLKTFVECFSKPSLEKPKVIVKLQLVF